MCSTHRDGLIKFVRSFDTISWKLYPINNIQIQSRRNCIIFWNFGLGRSTAPRHYATIIEKPTMAHWIHYQRNLFCTSTHGKQERRTSQNNWGRTIIPVWQTPTILAWEWSVRDSKMIFKFKLKIVNNRQNGPTVKNGYLTVKIDTQPFK